MLKIKNQISTKSDSVKVFYGLKSAEEFFVPIELLKSLLRKYKISLLFMLFINTFKPDDLTTKFSICPLENFRIYLTVVLRLK